MCSCLKCYDHAVMAGARGFVRRKGIPKPHRMLLDLSTDRPWLVLSLVELTATRWHEHLHLEGVDGLEGALLRYLDRNRLFDEDASDDFKRCFAGMILAGVVAALAVREEVGRN